MVLVERIRLPGAAGLSACLLALAACGPSAEEDSQRKAQLSGPVGLEHSVHPVFPTEGRMAVAGCCSFVVGDVEVWRLEGDVDGRKIEGAGYEAVVSFGNGIARAGVPGVPTTAWQIDGVTLRKSVLESTNAGGPRFIYRATVPLDDQAQARNIANPGLEIIGWCSTEPACGELTAMVESIRF